MKEIRKCLYCNKDFDINSIPYKKIGRRYVEESCYCEYEKVQNSMKVSRELEINKYHEVLDWVKDHLYNPNYALIQKQLNEYIAQGMKYESIYKTLVWYYDVCGNDETKAQGIGIVPYQFNNAKEYYRHIWELERQALQKKNEVPTEEIKIISPERKPYRPKKFSFLDEGGEDGK